MRKHQIGAALLSVFLLGGCGKRTVQEPYSTSEAEKTVSEATEVASSEETASSVPLSASEALATEEGERGNILKDYFAAYRAGSSREGLYLRNRYNVVSGQEYMDAFLEAAQKGEPAELEMIQYTTEGKPIFTYLSYDGTEFYFYRDRSRDLLTGDNRYQEETYACLLISEWEGKTKKGTDYYLAKDEDGTDKLQFYSRSETKD